MTAQLITFLEQPLVVLITGAVIKAGTGGNATKQNARAVEIEAIVNALQEVNNDQVAEGLTALQAAMQTSAMDPSEALAFQQVISGIAVQASAFIQTEEETIIGQVDEKILSNIASAVLETCALYPAPASTTQTGTATAEQPAASTAQT
jgi:hypothetical protein